MQRFFGGGRRACCNPFWNKPPHRLSPAPTSHKRLSSETQCGRGRHSLSFSLLPGKRGLVFAEASQPCPRWAGGRFCASPPPSLAAACGGDRPPRTPTPSITDGGGRRRRRASAPRPPAPPLSRAAALPQRLHRNAKPTPPLRSAPPLVCHARRLLREREAPRSPPRSRTPRAGGRRQAAGGSGSGSAGSRERPAARPRRGSPPPAPPVGK